MGTFPKLETTTKEGAAGFDRVLATARARLGDIALNFMSSVTSGVRLELLTDAPFMELDVALTHVVLRGTESAGSVFDIVVDGVVKGAGADHPGNDHHDRDGHL